MAQLMQLTAGNILCTEWGSCAHKRQFAFTKEEYASPIWTQKQHFTQVDPYSYKTTSVFASCSTLDHAKAACSTKTVHSV